MFDGLTAQSCLCLCRWTRLQPGCWRSEWRKETGSACGDQTLMSGSCSSLQQPKLGLYWWVKAGHVAVLRFGKVENEVGAGDWLKSCRCLQIPHKCHLCVKEILFSGSKLWTPISRKLDGYPGLQKSCCVSQTPRGGVVGQPDPQEVIDEDTGLQINAFCLPCFKEMPGLKMIKMKLSFLKALVSSSS